jgi:23S rRNA pseudouridine2605 synthase
MRLQKFLARAGVASRRQAERLIAAGRIRLNGRIIDTPGVKVDPEEDRVEVDGQVVTIPKRHTYLLLNKPVGYTCTRSQSEGKHNIFHLLPKIPGLHYVGRLDKNSRGLLLLTNDGELTLRLTHPRFRHEKEYIVETEREITPEDVERLETEVDIGIERHETVRASRVRLLEPKRISLVLTQGRYRQVRRMLAALEHEVVDLCRVRIKGLEIGTLPPGKWRRLTPEEVEGLLG